MRIGGNVPIGYVYYSESITLVDDSELDITVKDAGDWIEWCFDFPVEGWIGDGKISGSLMIAKDGIGEPPAFVIHSNDGMDSNFDWGTWLYSPWGPTLGDGQNGWRHLPWAPGPMINDPVTDLDWVEATGERDAQGTDGKLYIRILKSELGTSFHWAASPTVGTGWFAPVVAQYPATPAAASNILNDPIVAVDNYHEF